MTGQKLFYLFFFLAYAITAWSQYPVPKIEVGPANISKSEPLNITVTIYGPNYQVDDFPELAGFQKGTLLTKHSETRIEGKKVQIHTLIKSYHAITGGEFTIPSFNLLINEKLTTSTTEKITVTNDEEGYEELSITLNSADFVAEPSKSKIYVGEGVKVRLSFYLKANSTENWQFTDDNDLSKQIEAMAKRLKPENCLESRQVISSIRQREEYINDIKYYVYDIYEAIFYPLNNQNLLIPALSLKMKKGNGENAILTSKSQNIVVNELPDHPLRDKVPVGTFRIREIFQGKKEIETGESVTYNIIIEGQGNMNAIGFTKIANDKNLDFFQAEIKTNQEAGKLAGSKSFQYKILPKVAGEYNLGKYFSLIYFNIKTSQYDTLYAKRNFSVTGKTIESKDPLIKDIYNGIDNLNTDQSEFGFRNFFKGLANIILFIMVITLIYIWKKK